MLSSTPPLPHPLPIPLPSSVKPDHSLLWLIPPAGQSDHLLTGTFRKIQVRQTELQNKKTSTGEKKKRSYS